MLKNYLKIAFRNLFRKKLYGTINILGLALGLASSFVIGTWVYQELSYDQHFDNANRIYRVGVNFYNVGDFAAGPEVFEPVVEEFPEVQKVTSMQRFQSLKLYLNEQTFVESPAFAADGDFFEVFSFPFLQGNPATALDQPNQVVLTESLAKKLFGEQEALGQIIEIGEEKTSHQIVGVIKETGHKTHFNMDMWISLERDPDASNWTSARLFNYVLLNEGFSKESFTARLDQLIKDQVFPSLNHGGPYEEWIQSNSAYKFITTPLTDLYLKTNLRFDFFASGNATNVYAFAVIALFIILLAAINFVNISTARSSGRAKEVGIRKTLGSNRKSLVMQFLNESVITCFIAFIIALGLGEIFLTLFQQITSIELLDAFYIGPEQILLFLSVTILIGITAGLYPAFYLSSFKPVSMLKNQFSGVKKSLFRNTLVVSQFTISTCLIVGTGVVYQQLNFMQNKDLGFSTENILVISNADQLGEQRASFKQEVKNLTGVTNAAYSRRIPVGQSVWIYTFQTAEMDDGIPFQSFFGDEEYLNALGFRLVEGRNFSKDIAGDSTAVILNRSAVQELGLENPVGTKLNRDQVVVGVVDDFNYESLHKLVEPVAIMFNPTGERLALKIDGANAEEILANLRNTWEYFDPEESMNYYFLDERFQQTLSNERSLGKAVTIFSVFAIIISCLGLFGLSSYLCEQRTKEIGIRKILGAAVSTLVIFLNKDFTKLVLISIAVAIPLSYILMSKWLANFAYRVEINPVLFVAAGLLALLISWATVSGQSIKTALMNPVESLRSE